MTCPKCKAPMQVTNVWTIRGAECTRRHVCLRCDTVTTTHTVLVNVDPPRGEGAYALAKKLKAQLRRKESRATSENHS